MRVLAIFLLSFFVFSVSSAPNEAFSQTVIDAPELVQQLLDEGTVRPADDADQVSPWPGLDDQIAQGCCRYCCRGQPCGNSCISRSYRCHQPPGCACYGC